MWFLHLSVIFFGAINVDWSYDADSNDLIQILRVIIIQNASSDEMCSQELLPLLFHCLDQDDSEISSLV